MTTKRQEAIENGVRNAADTVKEGVSREEVMKLLKDFVSDGLNCAGLDDRVTEEDIVYARQYASF